MSTLKLGSREFKLPRSRIARIAIGVALILGGIVGFLPILGFWMIPLGIMVLAIDIPIFQRLIERVSAWWKRRRN
jgi:hypothetical protein